eukprot:3635470-Pleurochrysis_carterae.AAC.1
METLTQLAHTRKAEAEAKRAREIEARRELLCSAVHQEVESLVHLARPKMMPLASQRRANAVGQHSKMLQQSQARLASQALNRQSYP